MSYIAVGVAIYVFYLLIRFAFATPKAAQLPVIDLPGGGGRFALEVVGESFYTRNIERIDSRHGDPGHACFIPARLILDNNNPHDKNAVRVEIDGLQVGHLSRSDAKAYRTLLSVTETPTAIGQCEAKISNHGDDIWSVRLDTEV